MTDFANDPIDQRLLDELWERRTDAAESNDRIRQLEATVARLTEDLRRMDAITSILYISMEKRKKREETPNEQAH